MLLALKQLVLDVQLSTTAQVDDLCASSLVEFDVTLDFVVLTEPPLILLAAKEHPCDRQIPPHHLVPLRFVPNLHHSSSPPSVINNPR